MAGGEKQKQRAALAPSSGASRHLLPLRRRRVGVLGFPGRRHNRDSRLNPATTRNSTATVSFRTCRPPTPKPSPQPRPPPLSAAAYWLSSTPFGPPWACGCWPACFSPLLTHYRATPPPPPPYPPPTDFL